MRCSAMRATLGTISEVCATAVDKPRIARAGQTGHGNRMLFYHAPWWSEPLEAVYPAASL